MSEAAITAKAYFEKATKGKFTAGKPAGWVICDTATGKSLDSYRYPTEAEATADIPRVVAVIVARRDAVQAQQEKVAAMLVDEAPATPSARTYKTVHNGTYGTGRRYADQSGAVQYDDGSGRYSVQIWD
jgi:hypothetical protein